MKRVSDIISKETILSWKPNQNICIQAGTGMGKSYFIKNTLYQVAKGQNKKILFLIHRTNCVNQFRAEITRDNKNNYIDIRTYQSLEINELKHIANDLNEYGYIVCDEFHYWFSDSSFNKNVDISFFEIINNCTRQVRIFMSATGNEMLSFMEDKLKLDILKYPLPIEYKFIDKLTFFHSENGLEVLIDKFVKENKKAIFFIQSVEKAYDLYKKYKSVSLFNCSKNNSKYKYVDEKKINNMLVKERFDEQFLFTTSCLDAGVNIIDKELNDIVCDIGETGSLLQCIGRRRILNTEDRINIYIKTRNKKKIVGLTRSVNKRLEIAEYFKTHTLKEFLDMYPRQNDVSNMIYDVSVSEDQSEKRLNELMYYKAELDKEELKIISEYGDFGYCSYISEIFGIKYYGIFESETKKMELSEYLDNIIDKKLDKDSQQDLINRIDHRIDGKLMKNYAHLNDGLKMLGLPYIILAKRSNNERFWIVVRIELD